MSATDLIAAAWLVVGALGAAAGARWPIAVASSLLATALYRGPAPWVSFSVLVEVPLLAVVATRAVRRAPRSRAMRLAALAGVSILVLPLRFSWADVPDPLPMPGAITIGLGLLVVAAAPAGWALQLRLQDHRRRVAVEHARSEQRLTLARGLHDLLAHEITGVVLEAQAAQLADTTDTSALGRIETSGQRALASMDDLIAQLTDQQAALPHGLAEVEALVTRFTTTGGAVATVTIDPDLAEALDHATQALVYRAVLEALTNVRRHAGDARAVEVEVAPENGGTLVAAVANDGGATRTPALDRTDSARRAGGTGLAALRDDVAAAGGTLRAGAGVDGRWRVEVRVPTTAGRPPRPARRRR